MKPHAKTALPLALAIVGGMAAGLRCDASVTVETSAQFNVATPESQGVSSRAILSWIEACEETAATNGFRHGSCDMESLSPKALGVRTTR